MDVIRNNTILYCANWEETVAFYKDSIELGVCFESDWFVEFQVGDSYVSIADADRATVGESRGQGVTLSWEVADIDNTRGVLAARGVQVSDVKRRWGARVIDLWDPEGHRVELWEEPNGS